MINLKIKQLRQEKNFTQESVAKKLGISRQTYISIENGSREITTNELENISDLFETNPASLMDESYKTIDFDVKLEKQPKKSDQNSIRVIMKHADVEKFSEVFLYILNKVGAKPNVGQTVLFKLLYFIDFDYYEKFEEQLTGARYKKNHYGPTPIEFNEIIKMMKKNNEITTVKNKYFEYEQKKYLPLRKPDLSHLSAKELTHIDEVLARLSDKSANELSDLSHKDIPWKVHSKGEEIDYETVFYRNSDTSVRDYQDEV